MLSLMKLCFTIFIPLVTSQASYVTNTFRTEKVLHTTSDLNETQLSKLAAMGNITHMNEVLDHICIPRAVGTPGHKKVKNYLKNSMKNLGWSVESDVFNAPTPNMGVLRFENIIAKLNTRARRYLVLACHYDSLKKKKFVGAIDSAVPCAQLLNLATVMRKQLNNAKNNNVSLMFIFFDGEEAFEKWGPSDSIYGAKHLAERWSKQKKSYDSEIDISDLDRMDMLMLLDLLGASNPGFYNYFANTSRWYFMLADIEGALAERRKFEKYTYGQRREYREYFKSDRNTVLPYGVEDDHIPFLTRNVPILHLIPYGFPDVWHEIEDNRSNVDMQTTENLNKILRVFVASYLNLTI